MRLYTSWILIPVLALIGFYSPQAAAANTHAAMQVSSPLYPFTGRVYIALDGTTAALESIKLDAGRTLRAFPDQAPTGLETWRNWHYQWLRDGVVIANQSTATLLITQEGKYSVEVVYNTTQSTTSSVATLTSEEVNVYPELSFQNQPATYSTITSVLLPGLTESNQLSSLAVEDKQQVLHLVDGFGRSLQKNVKSAAPNKNDIISFNAYDVFGEQSNSYLPFTRQSPTGNGSPFSADAVTEQKNFYDGRTPLIAQDDVPYATLKREVSPLGRAKEQYGVGRSWQYKPAQVQYGTNSASDVRYWKGLDGSGYYPAGTLTRILSTDEDGRTIEQYVDTNGRQILQRRTADGATLETYYVYGETGLQRFVIPPAAIQALKDQGRFALIRSSDQAFVRKWLYEYIYDETGRLITRQFPGAAPVSFVYDQFGRVVLTQDGNRYQQGQWYFTKFDDQGRTVVAGLYTDNANRDRTALQAEADTWGNLTGQLNWETRLASGEYSLQQSFPSTTTGTIELLASTWYDDYDTNLDSSRDFYYKEELRIDPSVRPLEASSVTGAPTVVRKRILLSDGKLGAWLTTVLFYDKYRNVIQIQRSSVLNDLNDPLTLPNITTVVYRQQGFVSQVEQIVKKQASSKFGSVVTRNRFAYDHAGRIARVWQQNEQNGQTDAEVLVTQNTYNALGQLVEKNLHSQDEGRSFLQSIDLRYNIRGELLSLNNSELQPAAAQDEAKDLFGLALDYQDPNINLGSTPRFDGGISAVRWQAHNPIQTNQPERERSYRFTYDELGRLTAAKFAARATPGAGFTEEVSAYDEETDYDLQGNIQHAKRRTQATASASSQAEMDNLVYSYGNGGSNQVQAINDSGNKAKGFRDLVQKAQEYTYDANGSILTDENKGLSLKYNAMNKVCLQRTATGEIQSDFDTDGNLLRRFVRGPNAEATYYYVDGNVYEESTRLTGLAAIPTPEGRVLAITTAAPSPDKLQAAAGPTIPPVDVAAGSATTTPVTVPPRLVYEYHLRDHQGNLRISFRAEQMPRWLHLTMDNPAQEEGPDYPKFQNVVSTATEGRGLLLAQQGTSYAAVTASRPGPVTTLPVAHGDVIKVSFYYRTPAGTQYSKPAPISATAISEVKAQVRPILIPLPGKVSGTSSEIPGVQSRATPWYAGLQLNVAGVLSGRKRSAVAEQPQEITGILPPIPRIAYLRWDVLDDQNNVKSTGVIVAPVTAASSSGWAYLNTVLPAVDLSGIDSRTAHLRLQLVNSGSQEVHFDSLTIRHPQPGLLVSQEQHYYPFGLAMDGVAVNTQPAEAVSKNQFNNGSQLEDELLGDAANYRTYFRQYDPTTSRFMSVDPLANDYADQSPYHFGNNDPVNYNDPTGAWPQWFKKILTAIFGPGDSKYDSKDHGKNPNGLVDTQPKPPRGKDSGGTSVDRIDYQVPFPSTASNNTFSGGSGLIATPPAIPGAGAGGGIGEILSTLLTTEVLTGAAAIVGVVGLITLPGDVPLQHPRMYLGATPPPPREPGGKHPGFGHAILGLQGAGADSPLIWYHQGGFMDGETPIGEFEELSPDDWTYLREKGLQVAYKEISPEQYAAAADAILSQILLGPAEYGMSGNSCVTNVKPILRAAGYVPPDVPPVRTPLQLLRWFKSL